MATIDFTDRLAAMTQPVQSTLYKRVVSTDFIPGVGIEVYVNQSNPEDVYFSSGSSCELLGLTRHWINTSKARPRTMKRLVDYGFNADMKMIDVLVENSPTGMFKPCLGLSRSDFDALMEYAAAIGKNQAIALRNAFMLFGLVNVAGLNDKGKDRESFMVILRQCRSELEAN